MADTEHREDLFIHVIQLNIFAVGGRGHALPTGLAVIFGLSQKRGDDRRSQRDHQAQGCQIDIAAHVKNPGQLQKGEYHHRDHAAHSAPERPAAVELGPDDAQPQQDGGRHQPAVGKGKQIGGAAGELTEHKGDNADQEHNDLGHSQARLGVRFGIDQTLIDVPVGHGGRAQGGGGGGGD